MGNHEFCEGCGENDFHTGRTCQEAYPKSFAREEGKKQSLEKARGCVLIDELYRELKSRGIDPVNGGDTIIIYGFELARAEQKRNARKLALPNALHVGDELDALAEDIDRNGLMAATPAPGAEPLHSLLPGTPVGEALRRLEHEVAVHILSESPAQEFMDDIKLVCRTLREALAAAPPAPDERDAIQERAYNNGFEHGKVAADHASAERVRQLAQSWSHDTFLKNEGTLDEKRMHTSSTCRRCQLERALPPSTGEKSQ